MNLRGIPQYSVFRQGSRTYFHSAAFFPREIRRDIFILYGFLRSADDLVDSLPQNPQGFHRLCQSWEQARGGRDSGNPLVDDFVQLSRRRGFDTRWVQSFLQSMAWDLEKKTCRRLEETLAYTYGSAEVVGLFISRILNLPDKALPPARMLGRAMQYINFLRDLAEDQAQGRGYLPLGDGELSSLEKEEVFARPQVFRAWFREHLQLYKKWHREAAQGYVYLPRAFLVPIKTAEDMYLWTASRLEADPLLVYSQKVKPRKGRVVLQGFFNLLGSFF